MPNPGNVFSMSRREKPNEFSMIAILWDGPLESKLQPISPAILQKIA